MPYIARCHEHKPIVLSNLRAPGFAMLMSELCHERDSCWDDLFIEDWELEGSDVDFGKREIDATGGWGELFCENVMDEFGDLRSNTDGASAACDDGNWLRRGVRHGVWCRGMFLVQWEGRSRTRYAIRATLILGFEVLGGRLLLLI